MKSFLFTIKNPHNLPARIFEQRQVGGAICDASSHGPTFGGGTDLSVAGDSRNFKSGYSKLGTGYTNDTALPGTTLLAGRQNFSVNELEVFEVI
jgi:hypothetical protein